MPPVRRFRPRRPHPALLLVGLTAGLFVTSGCEHTMDEVAALASADPEASGDQDVLRVPLRVHLLQSKVDELNTTIDEAKVREWVAETNDVWKAAGIQFELTKVEKVRAQHEDAYQSYLDDSREGGGKKRRKRNKDLSGADKRRKKQVVAAIAPIDDLPKSGIDVFVLKQMIGAGGVFKCRSGFVLFGQNTAGGKPNHAKVFAHELGHALGLKHTKCAPDANLMMEPCKDRVPDASSLNDAQIEIAREIAASGKKRVCGSGDDVDD